MATHCDVVVARFFKTIVDPYLPRLCRCNGMCGAYATLLFFGKTFCFYQLTNRVWFMHVNLLQFIKGIIIIASACQALLG